MNYRLFIDDLTGDSTLFGYLLDENGREYLVDGDYHWTESGGTKITDLFSSDLGELNLDDVDVSHAIQEIDSFELNRDFKDDYEDLL